MTRSTWNYFAIALALFGLAACTTAAPVLKLKDASHMESPPTGVVLHTILHSEHPYIGTSGCELVVRKAGGPTLLKEIHIQTGKRTFVAQLEPGTYAYHALRCGAFQADLSFSNYPNFTVYPEKMSVAGITHIHLGQNWTYSMKVDPLDKTAFEAIMDKFEEPTTKDKLVSAYTGEKL